MKKVRITFSAPKRKAVGMRRWEHEKWTLAELLEYETQVLHGNHSMSKKLFGEFAGLRMRSRAEKLAGKVVVRKSSVARDLETMSPEDKAELLQLLDKELT